MNSKKEIYEIEFTEDICYNILEKHYYSFRKFGG